MGDTVEHRGERRGHRGWRRIAKKERRRRLRRTAARERDADEERLRAALERTAEYSNWREEQERLKEEKEAREREEHAELERQWLEEEVNMFMYIARRMSRGRRLFLGSSSVDSRRPLRGSATPGITERQSMKQLELRFI